MLEVLECPKCGAKGDQPFTSCPECGVNAEAYIGVMSRKKELDREAKKIQAASHDAQVEKQENWFAHTGASAAEGRESFFNDRITSSNNTPPIPTVSFTSHGESMQSLLQYFVGQRIGINYDDATKTKQAKLVAAASDHFSVTSDKTGLIYHFPYSGITGLVEGAEGGVRSGVIFGFEAMIFVSVYHQVVYKGAIGFGFGIPLGGGE